MELSSAAQEMVNFWKNSREIPFKGHLIFDENGENCMCAQGQVLIRHGQYTIDQLKKLSQEKANKEVARILNISIAHSILLYIINDREKGSPEDVLGNPERYLGPNYEAVLKFWWFLDGLSKKQWKVVSQRYISLDYKIRLDARNAAEMSAYVAADDATWDASFYAYPPYTAAGDSGEAPAFACLELIENVENPVFLPLFENL
jgi:hypothetical protein